MAEHWTEKNKHKAKSAFDKAPQENVKTINPVQQRPPQPQLTLTTIEDDLLSGKITMEDVTRQIQLMSPSPSDASH